MDSVDRFDTKVDNYVAYRPDYPRELIQLLEKEGVLDKSTRVADIGSGTGKLTFLFLENGNEVLGVEPNPNMRAAAEEIINKSNFEGKFHSIDGLAEATTLDSHSVDLIIVGQAFHWFNMESCQKEFKRILTHSSEQKPNVVLIWNIRDRDADKFQSDYEDFTSKHGNGYAKVSHTNITAQGKELLEKFYGGEGSYTTSYLPNFQVFDFHGLEGRTMSSSYMPNKGEEGYESMSNHLREIFDEHQQNGKVTVKYKTMVIIGSI